MFVAIYKMYMPIQTKVRKPLITILIFETE